MEQSATAADWIKMCIRDRHYDLTDYELVDEIKKWRLEE